jgi:hypothetical protein
VGFSAVAQAGPALNLNVEHYPVVFAPGVYITYDPAGAPDGKGLLTAVGYPDVFDIDGNNPTASIALDPQDWDDNFILTAVIEPTTGEALSGTLLVQGITLDPAGGYVSPLTSPDMFYSTILTGFSVRPSQLFEFTFQQEGAMIPPDGEPIGVILSGVSIPGEPDFTVAWENNANGFSNTFYMPEPASMITLLVVAGAGLARRRRRQA